jgi:hypothetical protein
LPPASGRTERGRPGSDDFGDPAMRRLDVILRALPASELSSLIRRMGIRIDAQKRIDAASQAARALVGLPDVRDPSRLPPQSRELLHRVAEAGGLLVVSSLPAGLEPLIARGVVYGRKGEHGIELVLPTAFLVQLRSWESEDPRSLRALLAQAPFETISAVAAHYLGRPATPPVSLSLEQAWEMLSDPARLAEEIERLAPVERRLLESIESVGGEVDTQELLDLEREPMRLRGATGVTASRRGAGFALERRAFLVPIHPNRHVVPTEVALIVGADRAAQRETRRAQIRSFVLEEDHAPRRARFASDPAPLAVALAFAARDPGSEVRSGVGTPRSMILRHAQRFGRDVEAISLVTALSRAVGLWDVSASSSAAPPGSLPMHVLTRTLFTTWRRGGAWDEARTERELYRVAAENRDQSPIGALREMVLEALQDLGEGRWVPWQAIHGWLEEDARIAGIERLLKRWGERTAVEAPPVLEVARRIALESLPVLGIIDIGATGSPFDIGATGNPFDRAASGAAGDLGGERGEGVAIAASPDVTLRITPRGRALLSGVAPNVDPAPSKFIDSQALRVGAETTVAALLGLSGFAEIGRVTDQLDLLLTPPSLARAVSAGVEADTLRARIEAVAPLPDTISRMLVQASVVIGKATLAGASGFLWVDDVEVRELLRTRRPASELFVDPSPPSGLLIAPDVDLDRLVRRCRALGVEIEIDGAAVRARTPVSTPTPPERTGPRVRSRTPMPRKSNG